jgi:hypothetical protein
MIMDSDKNTYSELYKLKVGRKSLLKGEKSIVERKFPGSLRSWKNRKKKFKFKEKLQFQEQWYKTIKTMRMNLEVEMFKCLDKNLMKNGYLINARDKEVEERINEIFHINLGGPEKEEIQLKYAEVPRFLAEMNIPMDKHNYVNAISKRRRELNAINLEEWYVWRSAINEVYAIGQCGPIGWPKKKLYINFELDENYLIKGLQLELIGLGTPLIELSNGRMLIEQRIGEKMSVDLPLKVYKLPPTIKRIYHNWIVKNEIISIAMVNFRKSYLNENGRTFVEFFNKEDYMWKTEKYVEDGKIKLREVEEKVDQGSVWRKLFDVMSCKIDHETTQEPNENP